MRLAPRTESSPTGAASPRGLSFAGAALGTGLLLLSIVGPAERADAARPRAVHGTASVGDLRFHARATPFRHGEREARAEFSIRVPYRQIKFVAKDSVLQADLRVTVELKSGSGKVVAREQQIAKVQVTDAAVASDSLLGEIYTVGLAAAPGEYKFKVLVEDMNVARRGLVYIMKNQKRQGEVAGTVDLGTWLFAKPALSGILPAWTIGARTEESRFGKGPYEVLPQPSGYYGLYQDVFSAYYEIYDAPPPPEGRNYRLTSRIVGASGDTVFTSHDSLRVSEGTAWPHALSIDLTTIAAGHYTFLLSIESSDKGARPSASVSEFDLLWNAESWGPFAADGFEVAAKVLLSAEEALEFGELALGAKEVRMADLWRSVDPTPETADNETYGEFLRRVQHSNVSYTVFEPGMFSDRGRIYIRFGEPDEIRIERLPVNDKTLGYAISGEIPIQSERQLSKQNSGIVDTRPYEIWTYELRGKELAPRRGLSETSHALKFVFVDEQGYGDYLLRYSSTSGVY